MPVIPQNGTCDANNSIVKNNVASANNNAATMPNSAKNELSIQGYRLIGEKGLDKYNVNDILVDIAKRIGQGRRLIIPIGLPQSGKSMFIASLLAYAFRRDIKQDNSCNFSVYDRDKSGITEILNALDERKTVPSTHEGAFSIIDLDMESKYRERSIKVSLIDLSGEDIERVIGDRPDMNGRAEKIRQLMNGCIAQKAIFAIISPVDESILEVGTMSDFDRHEDNGMKKFIDKIKLGNPNLYRHTKFLMIVTKWDKITSRISPDKFLMHHRQQLYNEYSGNFKSYGLLPFSVGNVTAKTIMGVNLRSSKNFWYTLYRWCTGNHVLPWWKRLLS